MAIVSAVAKAAGKKAVKKTAKGAAKKTAAKKAPAKAAPKPAPKPATNAVGMRFDMGAGASMGSSAPARSSYRPGVAGSSKPTGGSVMPPKVAAARVGKGTAAGMVPVAPYSPNRYTPLSMAPKTTRKVGAAVGSVAVTGGMVVTADQKQRQLSKAAKYRK
jgi:hypothetical protein